MTQRRPLSRRLCSVAARKWLGYRAGSVGVCLALVLRAIVPPPVGAQYDDFSVLTSQLNGLVAQRATMIAQLVTADGTVGALLARDALGSLQPALAQQAMVVSQTYRRLQQAPRHTPTLPVSADRAIGAGMLLGPHLSFAGSSREGSTRPAATQPSWQAALLSADTFSLAPASGTRTDLARASTLLAPDMPVPVPDAAQSRQADLGDAQDTAPVHALELNGLPVALTEEAPQASVQAPPLTVAAGAAAPLVVPVPGRLALQDYARATGGMRDALAAFAPPNGLASTGLNTSLKLTQVADVQAVLGHYRLSSSSVTGTAWKGLPSFLAPQVTWSFTATVPLTTGGSLTALGLGHQDGGSLHDLSLHAISSTGAPARPATAQSGSTLDLTLTPDGAARLEAVSTISGTITITTSARIDGVGMDSALQNALTRERLSLTELNGVLQAGNAVYARLRPLYDVRVQQYEQDLAAVMAHNAALEQTWWDRTQAWRAYQAALSTWKARQAAWNAYLAGRGREVRRAGPALSPPTSTPTAEVTAAVAPIGGTPTPSAIPAVPPSGAPIFGSAFRPAARTGGGGSVGQARHSRPVVAFVSAVSAVTPIFGGAPSTATDTPIPSATPPPPSSTPTIVPATATSTSTAADTATSQPSATETSVAVSSTETATPSVTASSGTTPQPSVTAMATITGSGPLTTVAPLPPGPPPAAPPPPGLEPAFEALPPPLPSLPAWIDVPPPVIPRALSATVSSGLAAAGYANITFQQLTADGALVNLGVLQPPLRGVITTLWGGSTPWQSFHPGIDIAAPKDTPVHAAAAGIVIYAGLAVPGDPTMSYGNCVMIMHNAHLSTLYGHMDMGTQGLRVLAGQVVRQGQIIGYEGSTGWATGPHVHFETRLDNVQFDPLVVVNQRQIEG